MEQKEKSAKVRHWCCWCGEDFEVDLTREDLKKLASGELHINCTNCKLECP